MTAWYVRVAPGRVLPPTALLSGTSGTALARDRNQTGCSRSVMAPACHPVHSCVLAARMGSVCVVGMGKTSKSLSLSLSFFLFLFLCASV